MHRELEIGIVVAGTRVVRCRETEYEAEAGSIVAFAPGEAHGGHPVGGAGSAYRGFLLPTAPGPAREGSLIPPGDHLRFESPVIRDRPLARRLARIHASFDGGVATPTPDQELLEAIEALFGTHSRLTPPGKPAAASSTAAVQAARWRIERDFAAPLRLSALAAAAGVSTFHLIRLFRAATGLTPHAYLEQVRVHRASELLRQGMGVSLVACLTGFADQSHLTRQFRKLVGVPPGEYRRRTCASPARRRRPA